MEEEVDLVIVGAGLYGISAAMIYHRLHPTARILLLEAAPQIGGPWAPHRIFPGLKSNNLWGTYQSPDYPMDKQKFGVKQGEHVPAEKMLEYLGAMIVENGLADFVRVDTKVEVVEQVEGGWKLLSKSTASGANESQLPFSIRTAKLILSTGLTNKPYMPEYSASPEFTPIVCHSNDFAQHYSNIVKPSSHTLIIGAGKSAWDVCYACATAPDSIATMLIRPSGNGPVWMSPSHVTPLKLWLEKLVFTRFFGFMSPCPWAESSGFEGWIRYLLHKTWLGRKIVKAFWQVLGDDVVELNKLNEHSETKKLRPWRGAFEIGNALSIHNYPTSFFNLVREGKIKIVIDEVEAFGDGKEILLKSGEKMEADAVVYATGWTHSGSIQFKPAGLEKDLGLAGLNPPTETEEIALIEKVERDLYTNFPFLKERDSSRLYHPDPTCRLTETADSGADQQPYRLYRFLVPQSDFARRSIGFAGALMTLGTAPCAYLQALWLAAYFEGKVPLPDTSTAASADLVKYEVYRDTQYCALRNAMGYGNQYPDLVFDSLPYFDLLMRDLGFEGKRKGKLLGVRRWGAECFSSYGPEDYVGLVDEWENRDKESGEGKKHV
ncbi:flavin-binding monooxygenase-like protein-like protein [Lojkania enalia]|uniref:L-ornithine N(5)-monooxygenase [NAD(P)H] n=1 Tax=Lojkania enalia TaxID=147567 RepID=A0A9P4JZR4_9PLEO|nr:flavin-binding monooxygenase-like protein-like protein [Didymosphaeria enalia]